MCSAGFWRSLQAVLGLRVSPIEHELANMWQTQSYELSLGPPRRVESACCDSCHILDCSASSGAIRLHALKGSHIETAQSLRKRSVGQATAEQGTAEQDTAGRAERSSLPRSPHLPSEAAAGIWTSRALPAEGGLTIGRRYEVGLPVLRSFA
jgi:hypothetical protein